MNQPVQPASTPITNNTTQQGVPAPVNNTSSQVVVTQTSVTNNAEGKDYLDKFKKYIEEKGTIPNTSNTKGISVKGISNILDAVLAKGIISSEQYNTIKFESVNTNKSFENLLVEKSLISPRDIVKLNAEIKGVEYVDLKNQIIKESDLNLLPSNIATSALAVVFESNPYKVRVAMADPLDLQKIKYLESIIGKKVDSVFASETDIRNIIDTKYGAELGTEVTQAMDEVGTVDLKNFDESDIKQDEASAPIIRIVNMILDYGIKNKASDIHIEPREKKIGVRFRIRGILYEKLSLPSELLSPITTRIKILSNLKIDEHRIPQDGRFQAKSAERVIDLRVSVMPSIHGEKIVMRLLEKTQGIMDLEDLGMRGVALQRMKEALKKTQGIILVTGPTGSGKTQTLASAQKILNSPDVNIVTLEDPVEIRIDGVTQVQVNPEVGLTFATGLRSFLRQDPDIIMVGEIRDSETAALAVQSALVGRLVLSTIHTNNASGAFIRLIDMGIEPFLLTSTVNLLMGQRLVRVLCECKEAYKASEEIAKEIHSELDSLGEITLHDQENNQIGKFNKDTNDITLYKAVGCPKCGDSGFISRIGIFEALKMSESIGQAVIKKATISDVQNLAISEGMVRMAQDGFIKALEGVTTIEEVIRVKNE